MIAILDYGVGNLFSLSSSLSHLGIENKITHSAAEIAAAHRIILPGVGAFGDAMAKLEATGLVPVLQSAVQSGTPLLGICLGMQLLFDESAEYGTHQGLGFIRGSVQPLAGALQSIGAAYKVPHMGWNALDISQKDSPLMKYTHSGDCVYFVHSFYATNCAPALVATAEYGVAVPACVANGNVYGCQFHPEKSGAAGLAILRAFNEIDRG